MEGSSISEKAVRRLSCEGADLADMESKSKKYLEDGHISGMCTYTTGTYTTGTHTCELMDRVLASLSGDTVTDRTQICDAM